MIKDKIYVLTDTQDNTVVSVHWTYGGARAALVNYLKSQYLSGEWDDFAADYGFKSAEDILETLEHTNSLDEEFDMEIIETVVQN